MRRENQELKTDAPSGHGLAAALAAKLEVPDSGFFDEPEKELRR
jgi:hypothetical protein